MAGMSVSVLAAGAPKIQFDSLVYDFGKTSQVATVSGSFKFRNVGDAVLKLEPPKPSCGCTIAELKPDTLPPGATGELPFTLHLGQTKAQFEKHIAVRSNDPVTPEVSLVIKADYTPLFELTPNTLALRLPFGESETNQTTVLSRADGKPLHIVKLEASKPWITATVETGQKTDDASARIRVVLRREGSPARINEYLHVFTAEQANIPVASLYISGQVMGEVGLSPEALYWSITDRTQTATERPEAALLRRVTIRSATGKPMELKNPQSSIKGIKLELVSKEIGKVYELVARLEEIPASTISGLVSFETSVAAQSRIDVPVIVNVYKP